MDNRPRRYCPIFPLPGSSCSVFKRYPDESENESIRAFVELGGGYMLERDEDDQHVITLVDYDWYFKVKKIPFPQELPGGRDYFEPRFLLDCWEAKKPVDLNQYRIGTSAFMPYDARDILTRKIAWRDLRVKPVHQEPNGTAEVPVKVAKKREKKLDGGKTTVSVPVASSKKKLEADRERSDGQSRGARSTSNASSREPSKKMKLIEWIPPESEIPIERGPRRPYTKEEGKAMLKYVTENNYHTSLGGIYMWQQMEKDKVCPNRTYQSMKEHFRKTVMKDLKAYNCSERDVEKFKISKER